MSSSPRCLLQVSTAGVLEMEKRRPVDVLAAILEERVPGKLESFFRSYDPAEAACMAYQLATSPTSSFPAVRTQRRQRVLRRASS